MLQTNRKISLILIIALLSILALPAVHADETSQMFENLVQVEDARVGAAYIDPNADFSVFKRVMILDTYVAFRSGWERDQSRGTRGFGVRASDMERIKSQVSETFNTAFIDVLQADDGFEIVDAPDHDVLLIRAAILDLDVTVPDTQSAGRSRTYTASSGAATLHMELFDSVSGQIIGIAVDRQVARNTGNRLTLNTSASNTANARRVFTRWAGSLREFLDSHYTK